VFLGEVYRPMICDGCGKEVQSYDWVWFENTPDGGLFGHYKCLATDEETTT
jgi:hypothetical protein